MSLDSWKKKLAYQVSPRVVRGNVAAVRRSYKRYSRWINLYRGGLPAGVFTTFAYKESNWKMDAPGDDYLGEVGFFQITKTLPPHFGIPAKARFDPESNVFLGGLEYNEEAAKFALLYPEIQLGTADSWKIARLVFAVGRGGTKALLNRAKPLKRGDVYGSLLKYIDKTGGLDLGRGQPAAKVWFRVHMAPVDYAIGIKALPESGPGMPRLLPLPPEISSYKIAPKIKVAMLRPSIERQPDIELVGSGGVVLAAGLAALGLAFISRGK